MTIKNSNGCISKRKIEVAKLTLQGYMPTEIAEKLGIARSTVHTTLQNITTDWRNSWFPAYEEIQTKKIAELNYLKTILYDNIFTTENNDELARLAAIILKILDCEVRIYGLYKESVKTSPINVENLIAEYEALKPYKNLQAATDDLELGETEMEFPS